MPDILLPLNLFGAGMEWHYLKKTPEYQKAICNDYKMTGDSEEVIVHNPNSIHTMWGHIKYEALQEFYAKSLFSIDLSTRGYTNYTHFEPLCYRTLSFIERNVLNDADNIIPEDCCVVYDMDTLSDKINSLRGKVQGFKIDQKIQRIRDNGQKFVKNMDCVKIAKKIVNTLENL